MRGNRMYMMIGILLGISGVVIGLFIPSTCDKICNKISMRDAEVNKEDVIIYKAGIKEYIWIELVNGLLYISIYTRYILLGKSKCIEDIATTILYCICITVLLCVVVIDWNTFEIPIQFNMIILLLGLIRVGVVFYNSRDWKSIIPYIIGFFIVSGFLYLLYKVSSGRWIGGGDVRLMATTGLLLGWQDILVGFMLGCILGSIIHISIMKVGKKDRMLAFGPYLSLGIALSMIVGDQLIHWYLGFIHL